MRVVIASPMPVSADELVRFHRDVRNLARISPPFPRLTIEAPRRLSIAGDVQRIRMKLPCRELRWDATIVEVVPGRRMVDVQRGGPFRSWRHQHVALPRDGGSLLADVLDFRFFPGRIGRLLDVALVAPVLRLQFADRHRRTRRLLSAR